MPSFEGFFISFDLVSPASNYLPLIQVRINWHSHPGGGSDAIRDIGEKNQTAAKLD
jgi:hypothetical protein